MRSIYEQNPANFGHERRQLLGNVVRGIQIALDGMEAASYFFDPDVAAALALFPAEKGLNQLQPPAADDPEPWKRDVHIAWELLEGSRRLYEALQSYARELDLNVEAGGVSFDNAPTSKVRLNDLVREAQPVS